MLCLSTLIMVGLSWPLWVGGPDFPRVPFLSWWPSGPPWLGWSILASVLATLAWSSMARTWRISLSACLILMTAEVLGDQSRLQPWVYQFEWLALALVAAPGPRALGLARLYAITLYAYSGFSKLDWSFVQELGPTFLAAGLSPLGLIPQGWPKGLRAAAILAMPAWEVAVAIGLYSARSRRMALVGAIAQHSALLAILGPWGLGHSPNVLIWNTAMIAEDVLLFWPTPAATDPGEARSRRGMLLGGVFGLLAIWPAGERLGLCDSWPGHALYASHAERVEIYVPEEGVDQLPASALGRLGPADFEGWRRLDLTGWSRDIRGVPVYPQARVGLGIAEYLAEIPGGSRPVRVILWGRASAWDGRRGRVECIGLAAIRRQAGRYAINARRAVDYPSLDDGALTGATR